jgi:hypothetical protein
MKTRCHNCGATASLDLLVSTSAAGQAFAEAFNVPTPLSALMLKYLGMFRPAERELAFGRATTLLKEINPFINQGKLTYNRQTTDAPLAAWAWGINQVLSARDKGTLKLPLGNHNYLFSIVQGYDHRKHSTEGDAAAKAYAGNSSDTGATVMINGLPKPVFTGYSKKETWEIVQGEKMPGELSDETYERIKERY